MSRNNWKPALREDWQARPFQLVMTGLAGLIEMTEIAFQHRFSLNLAPVFAWQGCRCCPRGVIADPRGSVGAGPTPCSDAASIRVLQLRRSLASSLRRKQCIHTCRLDILYRSVLLPAPYVGISFETSKVSTVFVIEPLLMSS